MHCMRVFVGSLRDHRFVDDESYHTVCFSVKEGDFQHCYDVFSDSKEICTYIKPKLSKHVCFRKHCAVFIFSM